MSCFSRSLRKCVCVCVIVFWSVFSQFSYFATTTQAKTFTWLFFEYFITKLYVCILHVMIRYDQWALSYFPHSLRCLCLYICLNGNVCVSVCLTINFKLYFLVHRRAYIHSLTPNDKKKPCKADTISVASSIHIAFFSLPLLEASEIHFFKCTLQHSYCIQYDTNVCVRVWCI